jgi:H+/Cl- antiporter ClcA
MDSKDILLEYPILKVLLGIVFAVLGYFIMSKNKFYKFDTDDMSFATNLKVFLGGLLFLLMGIIVFANGIYNLA